jgi:hypothetical protein
MPETVTVPSLAELGSSSRDVIAAAVEVFASMRGLDG